MALPGLVAMVLTVRHSRHRHAWTLLLLAITCGAAGWTLLLLYPGAKALVAGLAIGVAILSYRVRGLWLALLPAMLPVTSFAFFTGSFYVEEFDVFVLSSLCASYARAWRAHESDDGLPPPPDDKLAFALLALLALSYLIALVRGAMPIDSLSISVTASDYSPQNSLRIAKGFLWALLATPLLRLDAYRLGEHAIVRLGSGLWIGAAVVGLVAIWERVVFADLLDMASDYRISALFWEMHVGGAALDGFLALASPFVIWRAMGEDHAWRRAVAAAVLLIAAYTILVTFSRGLYAGIAVALAILLGGLMTDMRASGPTPDMLSRWCGVALAVCCGGLMIPVFGSGGYRALAAVLGGLMASLWAGAVRIDKSSLMPVVAVAAIVGAATAILYISLRQGAYWGYALAAAITIAALISHRATGSRRIAVVALGAYGVLMAAAAHVAGYWGGATAALDAAAVLILAVAATAYNLNARRRLWVLTARTMSFATVLAIVASIVAIMAASSGVSGRFSTVGVDMRDRLEHWNRTIELATDSPWNAWLGNGLGRFPGAYLWSRRVNESPGTFQLLTDGPTPALRLGGPGRPSDFGELVHFGQFVAAGAQDGPFTLKFEARAEVDTGILVLVCQRFTLYEAHCLTANTGVKAAGGNWKSVRAEVREGRLATERWFAPKFLFLSLSAFEPGARVDIRNVELANAKGEGLLRNGDFRDGTFGWFFTSDRLHLPWHAKNLWLATWFDQGWLGVVALALLFAVALSRLARAYRQGVGAALPLVAGVAAAAVVGLFDSLLDVPRVAFLFYCMLLMGLYCGRAQMPGFTTQRQRRDVPPAVATDRRDRRVSAVGMVAGQTARTVRDSGPPCCRG